MQTRPAHGLRRLILFTDAIVLVAALFAAAAMHRFLRGVLPVIRDLATSDQLYLLPAIVIPLFLVLIAAFGLHAVDERHWTARELAVELLKVHLAMLLVLAVLVFLTQTVVNRSLAALYLGCTFTLLYAERAAFSRWRRYQHAAGSGRKRVLIVGDIDGPVTSWLNASRSEALPPEFVGVLPTSKRSDAIEGVPVVGAPGELATVLHERAVDEVVFVPPLHRPDEVAAAIDACETVGVPATFWIETPKPSLAAPRVDFRFGQPVISFELAPRSTEALAVKHAFDVLAAAIVLILVSPLMLFAALLILVTMGRPIFFVQERAGLHGRTFRMRKFRTMVVGADEKKAELQSQNELTGPVFKMTADPRITRVGRFLRRTSVDELPQLFHVVSGTMSLVGPRPLPVKEQAQIKGWHRRRLSMKPGITGLWQVSGRSDLSFEQWMAMDLQYVDNWSLMLDAKILARTLPAVFGGRGAR